MTDKLTDNDRQRIKALFHQAFPYSSGSGINEFIAGYEAATIYEREQQIKTLNRPGSKYYVSYDPDYKDKVFGVFNKEDLTQQGAEKMAQQLNNLEAERSELRNKVIEQAIDICKDYEVGWQVADIIEKLNSLKTK